ncbi:MAG TPA: aromatic ring-hydroxylating dioxygenase subunit alpha [Caulobacteraceae bacterium]|nr:aromatic ring-hydroxylating dioxygenase subunit alpha [Caulobacteraceae bacterium]
MTFLENEWYAAAFSDEIGRTPLCRVLLDQPTVLYRKESGEAVALGDRCPHRFAPLHEGKLFGDTIRCPYHGLRFGPEGQCVDNPIGEGQLPRAAKVPAFHLHEVDGIVWLWRGDQQPDVSKIVRFEEFEQPDRWTSVKMLIPINGAYTLVADNLLDLSHAEFLHPDLAEEGFARRAKLTVTQEGDTIIARNWRPAEPMSNAQRISWGGANPPSHIDRSTVVIWNAPANIRFEMSNMPVGGSEGGNRNIQAHLITPETATTCHYFHKMARDNFLDDEEISAKIKATSLKAFAGEDKPMIEAQQRYMGDQSFEALNPVLLPSDAAASRARRVLDAKLQAQASARPSPREAAA